MKAPKNFYNTVDQKKLGIDDLFDRVAENEADIAAIESEVESIVSKEKIKNTKYLRFILNRSSGDDFHINGFRLHSSIMDEDFTFPGGSSVSSSTPLSGIDNLIQNTVREVGVWNTQNLFPLTIDFYIPTGVDLTVYNKIQFLSGYYQDHFPQSAVLYVSDDGVTYTEAMRNENIVSPSKANVTVDIFGFDVDPVIEDIYDKIEGHLLADVTSADEGKIMSVDSTGAWALAAPAGGSSNVLVIVATLNTGSNNSLTFEKTSGALSAEIRSAMNNGKDVVIIGKGTVQTNVYRVSMFNLTTIEFVRILRTATLTQYEFFSIPTSGSSNTITCTIKNVNDPT